MISFKLKSSPKEKKIWPILIGLVLLFTLLRSPRLDHELAFKMDAAHGSHVLMIMGSWQNNPWQRLLCPLDYRDQLGKLKGDSQKLYRHFPPLSHYPLGIFALTFGQSEMALRTFSIAMALLAMAMSFLFLRRWQNEKVAIWGCFILACCGHAVHYGRNSDPIVTNSYLLPLLAWLYLRYLDSGKRGDMVYFYCACAFSFATDWNAYPLVAAMGLHLLVFHRKKNWMTFSGGLLALPFLVLGAIILYYSLASGGWGVLIEDFRTSAGARTESPLWPLLFLEIKRKFLLLGVVIPLSVPVAIAYFCLAKKERHIPLSRGFFMVFLIAGAWGFAFYTRRLSVVHDYISYWTTYPFIASFAYVLYKISNKPNPAHRIAFFGLLIFFVSQSAYLIQDRIFKYDKDYLLARDQGQVWAKRYPEGGVLMTDITDLLQIQIYYSGAECVGVIQTPEELMVYEKAYRDSGIKTPFVFMTSTQKDVLANIPDIRAYPLEKLQKEYGLKEEWHGPLWEYLQSHYTQTEKVGAYTFFTKSDNTPEL